MLLRIRERYLTARQANGASPRDEERTREVLTLLDAIWSGNRALWAGDLAAPAIQGTTEDEPAPPARDPGDATAVAAPVAAYKRLMGALPAQWGRGPLSRLLTTVDHPLAAALLSRLWRPAAQATPRLLISERRAEGRPGPASPLAVGAAATVIDGRLSPAAIDLALDWSLPEGPPASFTPVTLRLTITRADEAAWATDEESAAGAGDAPEPDALASREFFGVLPELPGGSRVCWTVGRIDLATLLGERLATLAGESALLEITASLDRRDPAGPAARRAPAFTPADDEDDDALLRDVAAATRPAPPPAAPPATIPGRAPTR
ncbi:MAG: hypothetical protein HY719_10345, partial [Planctomycetes bacterium]|nr:hypothetical protein [Planctomycetota bacterium]